MLSVVRRHDRVWQTTPIIENRLKAFLYFTLTSGRLFGKTLKTSALSAMEMTAAPKLSRTLLKFAKLMNSWLFKGDMHFQALGTNFRVWSDGIVSPLFEEMSSTSQLIAKEYDDVDGRLALLNDPAWEAEFRREWMHGRTGGDFASWKTRMGIPDNLVIRDPSLLIFDGAPVSEWDGESFEAVSDRLNRYKAGDLASARTDQERDVFDSFPETHTDEPGFILHLLRRYDRHFRFYADVGNQGNRATLELLLGENTLPGFNDSGAHITNMAFFDANLMSLKLAKQQDEATVAQMVHRLTRKPAEVFGLDAGSLEIGARADLVLLNPDSLDAWEPDKTRELVHREVFDHAQMVNRSEGIVEQVWIAGTSAWEAGGAAPALGTKPLGQALRAA